MRTLRDVLVLMIVAAVPAVVAGFVHPHRPAWSVVEQPVAADELTVEQVTKLGDDAIWVDARSASAFEAGHVPGALLLNELDWDNQLPGVLRKWEPGMTVVVYCDSSACSASHGVAKRLREQVQLDRVYVLHGGWAAWPGEKAVRP
jgi:rhodanese-related sulfurtransferase